VGGGRANTDPWLIRDPRLVNPELVAAAATRSAPPRSARPSIAAARRLRRHPSKCLPTPAGRTTALDQTDAEASAGVETPLNPGRFLPQGSGIEQGFSPQPRSGSDRFSATGYPLPSPWVSSFVARLLSVRGLVSTIRATGMSCSRGFPTMRRACGTWSVFDGARGSLAGSAARSAAATGRCVMGCVVAARAGQRPRSRRARSSPAHARRW
jgi:hypothetical protein